MAREREKAGKPNGPRFVERDAEGKFREVDSEGRELREDQHARPAPQQGEIDRDDWDDGLDREISRR